MSTANLVAHELRLAQKVMLRDAQSVFFTIGLPLLYLVIFASFFGDQVGSIPGQPGEMTFATVMTASVVVIGVVSAAFQNLAVTLVQDRENGVLKRLRSTPVRTAVFLGGHVVNALTTAVLLALLVTGVGMLVYDVPALGRRSLAATVTVLVGAVALTSLAVAFTLVIRKASAAAPMTTALTLTLFFISGNFFPGNEPPAVIDFVASVFPVRPFFAAELTAFNPNTVGWGFAWTDLGVLALWGVVGFLVGSRMFRWTPVGEE